MMKNHGGFGSRLLDMLVPRKSAAAGCNNDYTETIYPVCSDGSLWTLTVWYDGNCLEHHSLTYDGPAYGLC